MDLVEKQQISKEEETIAAKRAERVAEKLRRAKDGFYVPKAWWSTAALETFLLTVILILNFYLVLPFFGTQAPDAFFSGPVIPLIAYYFGQSVAIIFHDYGSTLVVITWLFLFWWFSYSFVLESKEAIAQEKDQGV